MRATMAPARDKIVTAKELSRLSGVSVPTIGNLSKSKMIPKPVGYDQNTPLYDLSDPALADWLERIRSSGYHLRA